MVIGYVRNESSDAEGAPIMLHLEGNNEGVSSSGVYREDKEPLESWRLIMLTTAMAGVTLGYGLQVGSGTAVMKRKNTLYYC